MALYTRIGIATIRKRIWPFQIDRIGFLRSADILSAVRGHHARFYQLATASGSVPLDTNAGIAPAFHRAIGLARPHNQGEGRELSDSWPIKSKHLFRSVFQPAPSLSNDRGSKKTCFLRSQTTRLI